MTNQKRQWTHIERWGTPIYTTTYLTVNKTQQTNQFESKLNNPQIKNPKSENPW
jgi:hypothetical protein